VPNSLKTRVFRVSLSIFFTCGSLAGLSAAAAPKHKDFTRKQIEKILDGLVAEPPDDRDLECESKPAFKFIKVRDRIIDVDDEKLCKLIKEYESFVKNNVLPFWKSKEKFGLLIRPIDKKEDFNASFNPRPILNKATMPYIELHYLADAPVAPQQAVWAHEFGHAYLQENLEKVFYPSTRAKFLSHFEDNSGRSRLLRKKMEILGQEDDDIREKWSKASSEQIHNVLSKQQARNAFRRAVLDKEMDDTAATESPVVLPYHEFFADVFAVLLTHNPNAIGDSFDELGMPSNSDWRRFKLNEEIADPKTWNQLEQHELFTPTRSYFGKNILNRIKDPQKFLSKFADFIAGQLKSLDKVHLLSYQPFSEAIQQSNSPDEISGHFSAWVKDSKIMSPLSPQEIKAFCELDFSKCKAEIVEQLNKGTKGVFFTNLDPAWANEDLMKALDRISAE
jgi:hypothetical protein